MGSHLPKPLWVAVVCWQPWGYGGYVAVLQPCDGLLPVYDRGSAGVIALATLNSAREQHLVADVGLTAAYIFDRPPEHGALALRAGGTETHLSGLIGLIQFQGDTQWRSPSRA